LPFQLDHVAVLAAAGQGRPPWGAAFKAPSAAWRASSYERIACHYAQDSSCKQETRADYFTKRSASRNATKDPIAAAQSGPAQWTVEPPESLPKVGRIRCKKQLGGMLNYYYPSKGRENGLT
jgi:hypothetical protein